MAKVLELGKGADFHIKEGGLLAHQELTNGRFVPQPFDANRDSLATFIGSNGLMQTAADNVPRIETKLGNKFVLTNPQSTNLITFSQDFNDSSWSVTDGSITSDQVLSPTGEMDGDLYLSSSSGSNVRKSTSPTVANGDVTWSCFVKKVDLDAVTLVLTDNSTGQISVIFNFDSETLTNNLSSGSWTNQSSNFESFSNGWYRVCLKGIKGSGTTGSAQIRASNGSVYIWGSQLEETKFATSYIVTMGAIATRLIDQVTGAGDVNTFNSVEGVLNIKVAALSSMDEGARYITISDGTTSNVVSLFLTGTDTIGVLIFNGALLWSTSTTVADLTEFTEISLKYKINDFGLKINGVEVDTNTTSGTFSEDTLNTLSFNNGIPGTTEFFGKTEFIKVFDSATDY